MKRALIVGINDYPTAPLRGCVSDAKRMDEMLSKNGDNTTNFTTSLLTSEKHPVISRKLLGEYLLKLLNEPADRAIFYFSGHGGRNILGSYLVTQDAATPGDGFAFHDLLTLAIQAPIKEITIILDCCFSGGMGNIDLANLATTQLREGITIMAACRSTQLAGENAEGGIFTSLLIDALSGEAADIMGDISLASIYSYADRLLGAWDQRPMIKMHIAQMLPIRTVPPSTAYDHLSELLVLFPTIDTELQLDPEYVPSAGLGNLQRQKEFHRLQHFRGLNLVEPLPPHHHMYYAAMGNGSCRLTRLGRFYWRMAWTKK